MFFTMKDQRGVASRGGATLDFVKYDEESIMPMCPPTVADIDNQSKPHDLLVGGCLIISYNLLIKILKLKYQGEKGSPFEQHQFLMGAFIVALLMFGSTLAILGYDYGRSLDKKKPLPRHVYMVVKSVMYFSAIIAFLPVVLMLLTN